MGAYPYLGWTAAYFGLLLLLLTISPPPQRRAALLSALMNLPLAFTEALAIPAYWNPSRTVTWLSVSPEDILFCFTSGGMAWILATMPLGKRLRLNPRPGFIMSRYSLSCAVGLLMYLAVKALNAKPMLLLLLPVSAAGILLLWLRPGYWRISAFGLFGCTLVHFLLVKTSFALTPSFSQSWNASNLWGPILWGVPLDELVWSAAAGAVWPMCMAYAFDTRWVLPHQNDRMVFDQP
jgi:hypothetical protein